MKKISDKIKTMLSDLGITSKEIRTILGEEIKMSIEGKLMDGTMVYSTSDSWAVGSDIYTMDESGNPVPMASGEYTLEDGSVCVVDDKGLVTEIKTEVKEEEMSSDDYMKIIQSLSDKLNSFISQNNELATSLAKESAKVISVSKENTSLKTELSALKKSASAESVKDTKVELGKKVEPKSESKTYAQMTLKERILHNIENIKSN
jgi:regulator of replication initiation timing